MGEPTVLDDFNQWHHESAYVDLLYQVEREQVWESIQRRIQPTRRLRVLGELARAIDARLGKSPYNKFDPVVLMPLHSANG